MKKFFMCYFSILLILGIVVLFIEFSLPTLALLSVNILVLVLLISNQRMKKKEIKVIEEKKYNINGSNLMVFVGGKLVAFATNHKVTITTKILENASKDHASGTTIKTISWMMSTENLFVYDGDKLGQSVDVVFTINEKGTASTIQYTGKAFVQNLDINAPNGDNATYSVQLEGTGELKKIEDYEKK